MLPCSPSSDGLLFCEFVTETIQPPCYYKATKKNTTPKQKIMEVTLMKYVCDICGWEYDEAVGYPEGGIAPGTKWEDIPEDFHCPLCSVEKENFSEG